MDSKDGNTVSDTTAVEHQDKPESLALLRHENKAKFMVLRQSNDENEISSLMKLAVAAVGAIHDSDADNSKSELEEVISSAKSPSSADTSEGNWNPSQGRDAEASVGTSSAHECAVNMRVGTKIWDQDRKCPVCNQAGTIKNICGFHDRLPLESTTDDIIPPYSTTENGEKRLVDLPGTLKSVSSLKDLSAKKISVLGWPRWRTRNLSESEIHRRKICAAQNWYKYLSNKDEEQNVDSSKSPELVSGPSDIPPTEGEDSTVVHAQQKEVEESGEDSERKASFYISSSCSVPGMSDGAEWPSYSAGYQMPSERPGRRFIRQESREPVSCLGTQRCHYIVIAIALVTTVIGCIVYHLSHSGIVPEVLRPVGSTTAFMSFGVCVFSSIYIGYLKNYPQLMPMVPNYEMLGDVDSVMAMNRTSNPEFVYTDNGYYRMEDLEFIRQTQSADVLDRRGYWKKQALSEAEFKRYTEESGTDYSSQPQKKFKTGYMVPEEIINLTNLGFVSTSGSEETVQSNSGKEVSDKDDTGNMHENSHTSSEQPADSKISNNPNESDTNL